MKTVKFVSHLASSLYQAGVTPDMLKQIPQEQMLLSCDIEFAKANGGPITKQIIETLEANNAFALGLKPTYYYWLIDVKVVMLRPGEYPSSPGWHCDGVQRDRMTGQPDVDNIDNSIPHYITAVSVPTRASSVEFIAQTVTIPVDPERVWESVDTYVDFFYNDFDKEKLRNNEVWLYTQPTIHRYLPAAEDEWVVFFKCSASPTSAKNLIRQQVQVYTPTKHT